MKVKIKLRAITNVVTQHVEKVILALACVLALVLIWGGIATSGGLDWDPAKLVAESGSAEMNIESGEVGPDEDIDWTKTAAVLIGELKWAREKVPNAPYEHAYNWTQTFFDDGSKRDVPPLFTVEGLRATAGRGAVRMNSPDETNAAEGVPGAGRGDTLGQRWVVLTGAIPVAKQEAAYKEAFKNAYQDPIQDVPSYIYYRVERAEVALSGDAADLQWERLNVGWRGALKITKYWNSSQSEVVNGIFIAKRVDIPMAFPLAPVTNYQWGPEIAHAPEIPLYYEAELTPEMEDPFETDATEKPGADEPGMEPIGAPGGVRGRVRRSSASSVSDDNDGGGMRLGRAMGNVPRPRTRVGGEPITVQLFRFFDFNVVPGKHYRYRVRLLLANPNQDIQPEFLARPEIRKVKYLETEFSDPTNVVTVPLDSRLLCIDVATSPNQSVEPSSRIMSVRFDPETGDESAVEHDKIFRGQMANFLGIPVKTSLADAGRVGLGAMVTREADEDIMETMMGGQGLRRPVGKGRQTKRNRKPDKEVEMIDHLTQNIVLDMQGGQKMGRELTQPCDVLLLDPSGQLVVRSDLDDLEEFLSYSDPERQRGTGRANRMDETDEM